MDYSQKLSPEILDYITKVGSFYPADLAADDIAGQRACYDRMAAHFHHGRPEIAVTDQPIAGVPSRIYGAATAVTILYVHGGGFVVGGLESHDDVCAEIADRTGLQVISVDYRLSPEHAHPAAYNDVVAVAQTLGPMVLCGDSAGGTLCASVTVTRRDLPIKGQVLIYPMLGYPAVGGSFATHAHAPMLTTADLEFYGNIRGGDAGDPRAYPCKGDLSALPYTHLFPAECDPLCDDATRFADDTGALVTVHMGLAHSWMRARRVSDHTHACFDQIIAALMRAAAV